MEFWYTDNQRKGKPVNTQTIARHVIIAVSDSEAYDFGCPHCGGIFGTSPVSGGGSRIWRCADCWETSIYLADGITKSTIGIGSHYPELQPHPRRGQPVNRTQLVYEREKHIESEAFVDLRRWLLLGHGHSARITQAGSHISKSRRLPIIASETLCNVSATWFSDNYYSYFLGAELKQPIPATLLYPISAIFGRYALSGHVNTDIAPPLTNFQKAYHNCTPIRVFGGDCGGYGFNAALVIRYLEEVSKLDIEKILDVCLRKTRYGATDHIDGNGIKFADLAGLLDLAYDQFAYYDFDVQNAPTDVFERVNVDWFDYDLGVGRSSIHITMKENMFLPPMPFPADIYVDLRDTLLDRYIPQEAQERPVKNRYDNCIIQKIPARLLQYQKNRTPEERQKFHGKVKHPIHNVYEQVNLGTREFTFNVSNVLDCVMTAFFFTKVFAPAIQDINTL